jgi:type I restriction enzyme S subunit
LLLTTGLKRIDPKLANAYRRTTLHGGELLLCVRGSTGAIGVASTELAGANVTRGIVPIVFNDDFITKDFGYYLMISGMVQSQIREKTYGTALMQINIRDLRKLMVVFPTIEKQGAITTMLHELFAQSQRLLAIYQLKLNALSKLKTSLLHQAFSGQL